MSRIVFKLSLLFAALFSLSACQYEDLNRSEYMSSSAGNAIAHNSALQIADPWPRSSGNNDLRVPTGKYGGEPKDEGSPPSPIIIQAGNPNKE